MFCGEAGCGGAGAYAQFVVDGVEVAVYGVGAYEEFFGDPGVCEALCHEREDFYFSGAEVCRVGGWSQSGRPRPMPSRRVSAATHSFTVRAGSFCRAATAASPRRQ